MLIALKGPQIKCHTQVNSTKAEIILCGRIQEKLYGENSISHDL